MNPDFDSPSSIPSMKRLAKAIQRAQGCKYLDALDIAASRAGYPSFEVARRAVACRSNEHVIEIIDHWRDSDSREAGTVRLTLKLSQPLNALLKPHHLDGRLSAYKI